MVDRFTITAAEQDPWIDADANGQWVRYADYAALEAKLAERAGGVRFVGNIPGSSSASGFAPLTTEPGAPEGRQDDKPRAYVVHAPEDDYYGTGPDRLQFHPLAQRDLDNGYRQTPLYERPAHELSGNTGELIDKMAEAIRGDTASDDTPWATLSEDRKIGWRGDAERALAVVKEYLTARRPSEQAVTEAMVEAAAKSLRPDLFTPIKADVLQSDDYALTCRRNAKIDVMGKARAALKAAMEVGR